MVDVHDRRATWVGLRTLRQRPAVVGRTPEGDPVYEVRSVRLVLRGDAPHFSRLVQCSRCSREVPGPPVLSPADLDHPVHAVICAGCVRAASVPSFGGAPAPAAPDAEEEPDRLAALEQRVAEQERRIEALTAAGDEWASRVHALEQRSQASITRLTRLLGARGGGRPVDLVDALEGQLRGADERLAQRAVVAGDDPPE